MSWMSLYSLEQMLCTTQDQHYEEREEKEDQASFFRHLWSLNSSPCTSGKENCIPSPGALFEGLGGGLNTFAVRRGLFYSSEVYSIFSWMAVIGLIRKEPQPESLRSTPEYSVCPMPLAYPEWLGGSDVLRHSSTDRCVGRQDRLPPCPHKCCSDRVIIYTCTCVPGLELDRLVGIATSWLDWHCGDILLLLSRKGVCFSGGQGGALWQGISGFSL